ncbi:Hint domain-containing protein [Tateyamaria sp.]|uniref:Hint domain-containing protein n=1 Tax=Tateyamaria sp. TaxID=1929288 RepID=UPI0032A13F06
MAGAKTIDINVDDGDDEFDDGFQDFPNGGALNQILRDDIDAVDASGNAVTVTAGAALEVEFTLRATAPDGTTIDLLFVAARPRENQGNLTMVVSTDPLEPGVTYDIAFLNDGGGTPYGELVCFARGTLIRTARGDVPVETLQVGDAVMTADDGPQPIVWTAHRAVLFPRDEDQPVCIAAHAFGADTPYADTRVSPRHCILREEVSNQILFDEDSVLIAAHACVDGNRITKDTSARAIEYHHFMIQGHAIVWANGMPTESFYPGKVARRALDPMAHARLVALYPELSDPEAEAPFPRARIQVRGYEQLVASAGFPSDPEKTKTKVD